MCNKEGTGQGELQLISGVSVVVLACQWTQQLSVSQWLYQHADVNSTCVIPGLWDKGIVLETPVVTVPQSVTMWSEDNVHCCDTLSSRVWKLKKPYIYIYVDREVEREVGGGMRKHG